MKTHNNIVLLFFSLLILKSVFNINKKYLIYYMDEPLKWEGDNMLIHKHYTRPLKKSLVSI